MSRSEMALGLSLSPSRPDAETIISQRAVMEKLDVYKLFGINVEGLPFSLATPLPEAKRNCRPSWWGKEKTSISPSPSPNLITLPIL